MTFVATSCIIFGALLMISAYEGTSVIATFQSVLSGQPIQPATAKIGSGIASGGILNLTPAGIVGAAKGGVLP